MSARLLLLAALLTAIPHPADGDTTPTRAPLTLDVSKAAERLGEYIRIDTSTPPEIPAETAAAYISFLVETYAKPLGLEHEVVLERTLLLKWRAAKAEGKPLVFMSHSDVVPVAENERIHWTHPPFGGEVADGYVWGRGALDTKSITIAQLEAVAALQAAGIGPNRDIFFLVNPDEEIGGVNGAGKFVREHLDKLENPIALIDEGSLVVSDVVPGKNVAAIGVGEKEYVTVKLTLETQSGHSSMPSLNDAPRVKVAALARANEFQYPAKLLPPTKAFLEKMSLHVSWPQSFILSHPTVFGWLIAKNFEKKAATNAVVRTTHALTMLRAGVKDNVIPRKVEAWVNFRILPGESHDVVFAAYKEALGDSRVGMEIGEDWGETPIAPYEGVFWDRLTESIEKNVPNSFAAPSITPGTTDARYFAQAGIPSYRFAPFTLDAAERQTIHGVNERVSLENLEQALRVYAEMMRGI